MIPFNRASFDGNEFEYIVQAVDGGHVSGNGPFTLRAEQMIEQRLGTGKVLLTTSCTHALEMTALLLRLQPGDEVVVPSFTFVSTASAFALHGGKPVFADVDVDTLNLDPNAAEAAISSRTRAICVVHYAGVAAELDRLTKLAERYGLALIEDNAHGLFGTYRGTPLGTFGTFATQSFHETKNVTCGEGGALVVNQPSMVERAEILREKGTDRSRFLRGQVDRYTWVDVGSSYAMADILAAVLVAQLEALDQVQERRHQLYSRYTADLAEWAEDQGVRLPSVPPECGHTAHLFHLRLPTSEARDRFIRHLRDRGVHSVFHYQPLHLSEVGLAMGGLAGQCPVAEDAASCLARLPLYSSLTDRDHEAVIASVLSFDV